MRILICGGREFANEEKFERTMKPFVIVYRHMPIVIIHGACGHPGPLKGADAMADKWGKMFATKIESFPADWKKYGNSAGPIRNEEMLRVGQPDWVIAFPGGSGTRNMVELTRVAINHGWGKITLAEIF